MKEFFKKNVILVVAFLLPIILIVVVALSTYLPSLFLSTNYNFVYSSCGEGISHRPYGCEKYLLQRYSVIGGKLVINDIDPIQDSDNNGVPDVKENYSARLFLHNTETNESREITLDESQALTFNELLTSPDGVTVGSYFDRGSGFFLFFDGGSSYGYYLTKGKSRSKLNLINQNDRYYYRDNFQFIGWVLPGRN